MKARPRPLARLMYQTVLDRIEKNVITMPIPVRFVADTMLPISGLPHADLPVPFAIGRHRKCPKSLPDEAAAEQPFDIGPANGKVVVMVRQGPKAMDVIGQENAGEHIKRPATPDLDHRPAKQAACERMGKERTASVRHNGEKIGRAALAPAHIIRHGVSVSPGDRRAKPALPIGESAAQTRCAPST